MIKEYSVGDKVYCADKEEIADSLYIFESGLDRVEGVVADVDKTQSETQYTVHWVDCETRRRVITYLREGWHADQLTTDKNEYLQKISEVEESLEADEDYKWQLTITILYGII